MPWPWRDRVGRFSRLKLGVFLGCLAPGLWLAAAALLGELGAKPVTAAIHWAGDWCLRFLWLSLLITPLRRLTPAKWAGRIIQVRRMLGVTALAYGVIHLGAYGVEQNGRLLLIVSEIARRYYLQIGFVALLGLVILGLTSTDGAMRRLGRRWGQLHKASYAIAVLGGYHFFLQSKLEIAEAALMAGLLVWLFAFRIVYRLGGDVRRPVSLLAMAIGAAMATAALEYGWYALATAIPADRILAANLSLDAGIRPAGQVLGATLLPLVLAVLRPASPPHRS